MTVTNSERRTLMPVCKRCGGQLLRNYDEVSCLQCGYDPDNCAPPTNGHKAPIELRSTVKSRIYSVTPAQIRRRRRRLILRGYSDKEADKIILQQVEGD